jgi:MoxR-like ATPase
MPENSKRSLDTVKNIRKQIHEGLIGQEDLIDGLLAGLIANGHLLIEGVPGLAKTRAVNLLANICRVEFKRIQFTPDLLPADIIGTRIYNQSTAGFETKKGPIFANFILADEINRAPAKVQSALLEAMQEKSVTIGEETFKLSPPFLVFATQNPIEQEGTYPLPEAQVDRFIMKLIVTYPTQEEEEKIVGMISKETKLPKTEAILDSEGILELQRVAREIFLEDKLVKYITSLVFATRDPKKFGLNFEKIIQLGASPRASIALATTSRARALLAGRDFVSPDDIKEMALPVLRHRVTPTYYAEAEGITSEKIVAEILQKVKVP